MILNDLTGLDNLEYIGQSFNLSENDSLINLEGLNQLDSIGNYLEINKCNELTDLIGLDSLKSIDVSSLQPGIYIIEVASGKSRYTKKLVIL